MTERVYLPVTQEQLAELVRSGSLPAGAAGHAVTATLRRDWPDGSEEEWEYAVLHRAAQDCADRVGAGGPRRRMVLVAEVERVDDGGGAGDAADPTAITVVDAVSLTQVAAVHADADDHADPDDDLGWYATQEIPDLI